MLRSYTPADMLTLANASCGTLSVFACLSFIEDDRSTVLWAAFLLPGGISCFVDPETQLETGCCQTGEQVTCGAFADDLCYLSGSSDGEVWPLF